MRVFPFRFYRDPAESAKFPSELSCKGCVYEVRVFDNPWQDTKGRHCAIGHRHGKRCISFLEPAVRPPAEDRHGPRR